jgi:hypothetical protein
MDSVSCLNFGFRPLRAIRATPADGRVDEEADLRTVQEDWLTQRPPCGDDPSLYCVYRKIVTRSKRDRVGKSFIVRDLRFNFECAVWLERWLAA